MNFKKQIFGFMDMLRFKKLVPNRREALASGSDAPLPQEYRTNELAKKLHPGNMEVELVDIRSLTPGMKEFTFKRIDSRAFPFFRAGQYVSLQGKIGNSYVSRPYSIVSSPREALENKLVLAVEDAGFFSGYLNREAKVGERFIMTEPAGEFHYETLRDQKKIVCIAGGSGITPFLSMAKSMEEGDESYEMILFYGARDEAHLAYKKELDALAEKGLKVIYVLSDEERQGYEHGFVTAELLEKEGAEAVVPDLIDFFCYSFYNSNFKAEYLGAKKSTALLSNAGLKAINWLRSAAVEEFKKSRHFDPPARIEDLAEYASPIVSVGNQTGEGWFLTGEMMELIHSGVFNIVCTQPFACLPNHIVGKGVIKAIRKEYPKANIVAVDYDPGASEVNQLNRIKLMLSTAVKNLEQEEQKDA